MNKLPSPHVIHTNTGQFFGHLLLTGFLVYFLIVIPLPIQLIIFSIGFGFISAIFFRSASLYVPLTLFFLLPPIAISAINNPKLNNVNTGLLKNHPISIILCSIALVTIVPNYKSMVVLYKSSHSMMKIALATQTLFICSLILGSFLKLNISTVSYAVESFIAPFILFLLICFYDKIDSNVIPRLQKIFIMLSIIVCIYGFFEFYFHSNYFYGEWLRKSMEGYESFTYSDSFRIFTTMGHPLVTANAILLSFFFLISLYYSGDITNKYIVCFCSIILIVSLVLTGSRSGLLLLLFGVLLTFKNQITVKNFIVLISFVTISAGMLILTNQGKFMLERFMSKEGLLSSAVRLQAVFSIGDIIKSSQWFDAAFGKSRDLSDSMVLKGVSFENPWLMIIVDTGVVPAFICAVSFIFVLISLFRVARSESERVLAITTLLSICMLSGYNSFAEKNLTNIFFWFPAAICYCQSRRNLHTVDPYTTVDRKLITGR
ncbi:MAG: hypothetical protein PHI31_10110 [Desulfuromonadaceae bacterium]|nr:hypothetical protein [Desulfuromonadaceae bacterium]